MTLHEIDEHKESGMAGKKEQPQRKDAREKIRLEIFSKYPEPYAQKVWDYAKNLPPNSADPSKILEKASSEDAVTAPGHLAWAQLELNESRSRKANIANYVSPMGVKGRQNKRDAWQTDLRDGARANWVGIGPDSKLNCRDMTRKLIAEYEGRNAEPGRMPLGVNKSFPVKEETAYRHILNVYKRLRKERGWK